MKVKSLFASKQFWWALAPTLLEVTDKLGQWVSVEKFTNQDAYEIFRMLVYSAIGVFLRYTTDSVTFTPPGIPGRNRSDAVQITRE